MRLVSLWVAELHGTPGILTVGSVLNHCAVEGDSLLQGSRMDLPGRLLSPRDREAQRPMYHL